jgi:hypothetical protein
VSSPYETCYAITTWEGEGIRCDLPVRHAGFEHFDRGRHLRWVQDGFKVSAVPVIAENVCESCGCPVIQMPPDLTDGRWLHSSAADALACEALRVTG